MAFVDVERLAATYLKDADPEAAAYLKALRAVGLSVAATEDGTASTLRVTTR